MCRGVSHTLCISLLTLLTPSCFLLPRLCSVFCHCPQAHGLAFSVQKGVTPPPSLRNVFQELEADVEGFSAPRHGCLQEWADRGVLLLNTTLTVRKSEAASHSGQWDQVTDAIVRCVGAVQKGGSVVFMLWGRHAQAKAPLIQQSCRGRRIKILKCAHPSPYSAQNGFFGSKHFSQANAFFAENRERPVDWSLTP
jgi:uracil-DNA glycosylase